MSAGLSGSRRIRYAVAREGAGIGVRMTRMYAGAFIFYGTLRIAMAIVAAPASDVPVVPTVIAAAASMAVASVTITTLLAIISAIVGAVTAIAVHWVLVRNASKGARARPIVVGVGVAVASLAIGQLGLLPAVGFSPLSLPLDAYLFWIGIPSVLYLIVATWLARPSWRHARQLRLPEIAA